MAIPVSGPGPYSQRTDRQPIASIPNAGYGEQKAYKQLQQDAPMAQSSGTAPSMDFAALFGNPGDRVIPMGAESNQPGTPVTDGAARGAGAGVEAMNFTPEDQQSKAKIAATLSAAEYLANKPDSSAAARNAIRRMKASL